MLVFIEKKVWFLILNVRELIFFKCDLAFLFLWLVSQSLSAFHASAFVCNMSFFIVKCC